MRLSALTIGTYVLLVTLFVPVCAQSCEETEDAGENSITVCSLETMIDALANCSVSISETYKLPPSGPKNFTRYINALKVSYSKTECNFTWTVKVGGNVTNTSDVLGCAETADISFSTSSQTEVEIEYKLSPGAIQIIDVPNQFYRRRIAYVQWGLRSETIKRIDELIVSVESRGLATVDFTEEDNADVSEGLGSEKDNPNLNSKKNLTLNGVTIPKVVLVRLLNNWNVCPSLQEDGDGTPLWAKLTIVAVSILAVILWVFCSFRKTSAPAPAVERVPLTVNNPHRPMSPRPVVTPENTPQVHPGFRQRTPAQEQQATPDMI